MGGGQGGLLLWLSAVPTHARCGSMWPHERGGLYKAGYPPGAHNEVGGGIGLRRRGAVRDPSPDPPSPPHTTTLLRGARTTRPRVSHFSDGHEAGEDLPLRGARVQEHGVEAVVVLEQLQLRIDVDPLDVVRPDAGEEDPQPHGDQAEVRDLVVFAAPEDHVVHLQRRRTPSRARDTPPFPGPSPTRFSWTEPRGSLGYGTCAQEAISTKRRKKMGSSVAGQG